MSNLVAMVLTFLLALTADAQVQSADQRKCLGATDKGTAKIFGVQWKAARKCLSEAAAGKLPPGQTAAQCLVADDGDALAKAITKAEQAESKLCAEEIPGFGHAGMAERSAAAIAGALGGFEDLFSDDPSSAVIAMEANKPAAKCQANVAKASGKALSAMLGEFLACKAAGLKDETIASDSDIDGCFTAIDTDAKGKIAKAAASLASAFEPAECSATLFPGTCSLASNFSGCVINTDRCRICEVFVRANQLTRDCDQFDDSLLNLSCGSCADADCDVNATCTSTGPVSYECNCNSGYAGDGASCAPINSCLTNNGGCDDNATCTSTGPGTNSCACNSGYAGDGTSCEAINSCLTNNGGCDAHATCTSTGAGTNSCACNSPYTGDGISCSCTPVFDPPTLNGFIKLVRIPVLGSITTPTTTDIVSPGDITVNRLNVMRNKFKLDARAFVDPAACSGETLDFHWFITTPDVAGDYAVAGVSGYRASVLEIDPNSLIGGTVYTFRLVVTSTASPATPTRSTTVIIETIVTSSDATIEMFNTCQDTATMSSCMIPNLLPATEPT